MFQYTYCITEKGKGETSMQLLSPPRKTGVKHPTLNLKVTFLVLKRKLWNSMATMSWEMHPYASHTIFFNVRLNELATTFCQLLLAKAFVDNIGVAVHATQTLLQYSPVVVLCSATPKSCDITSYVYSLMHNITELLATVT